MSPTWTPLDLDEALATRPADRPGIGDFRAGDPIALADLLALPPDGKRWGRDDRGRLCLMLPEDFIQHRLPIGALDRFVQRAAPEAWHVLIEPSLALPTLFSRRGPPIPSSPLGPRAIEPDLAVFDRRPVGAPPNGRVVKAATTEGLRLVVEVLSPDTWRNDLGIGSADEVDCWRSYLASGVPELWLVNMGAPAPCPLPQRSGLFLRNAGDAWEPLPVEGAVHGEGTVHGHAPLRSGVVVSTTGMRLDLDALWSRIEG